MRTDKSLWSPPHSPISHIKLHKTSLYYLPATITIFAASVREKKMLFLALLMLMVASAQSFVGFVKPSNSSDCPADHLCLTLDEYALHATKYFTTGASFLFLDGNHTLENPIILQNVSDIIFEGTEHESDVTILFGERAIIYCNNVVKLTIQNMKLTAFTSNMSETSMLNVSDSKQILFLNSTFEGTFDVTQSLIRTAYISHSDVLITNCLFKGNVGEYGGALLATRGSNITLDGNMFFQNHATKEWRCCFCGK